ncbi:hypothetical protein [Lysobacter sp. N42]|uniref:hypothetical protein n=1 Tax=Lysobacter sp. N42 TaxID=2545719 RepID=UPI001FB81181|nr:hypothetical protein [Lysobacter sp. N42]
MSEMGTSCSASSRFCAVTRIESSVVTSSSGSPCGGAGCVVSYARAAPAASAAVTASVSILRYGTFGIVEIPRCGADPHPQPYPEGSSVLHCGKGTVARRLTSGTLAYLRARRRPRATLLRTP